jgi:hypothetical protein
MSVLGGRIQISNYSLDERHTGHLVADEIDLESTHSKITLQF